METQVRTPHAIFNMPQRLVVPLFQRPYVWNEENQWEPLWDDITRIADRVLKHPGTQPQPHFLGAVVLQQLATPIGLMQARTIIDGQQRLTTLQLVLDALHAELVAVNAIQPAMRLEALVTNPAPYCTTPEDRFKVWPTNRDRPAFNAVMGATPPINYDALGHSEEKLAKGHRYFSEQAREWLNADGPEAVQSRAAAIELVVRDRLQIVVIDLAADENAQEIFETLNARGTPLTAADLIKNFVFQRLSDTSGEVETAYSHFWKEFETGFWETEVSVGRVRYPRSSIFLNHWLTARTGEDVVAREVFNRFKKYADYDAGLPMLDTLRHVHNASGIYRSFITGAASLTGPIDHLSLFGYRTGALESEVIKPIYLCLHDPEKVIVPADQIHKALNAIESWMVRRMLVRATTKRYNLIVSDLIAQLNAGDRASAGDFIVEFLRNQTSDSAYWPDDAEVRSELASIPAYRRLRRGRLRMVLEAVEDHLRGWKNGQQGLGGERVTRGKLHIEHVMPRKWQSNWSLPADESESERDQRIHTLGNLTLLTGKLNSKVSNGPWSGADGKRQALEKHDVFLLNRELLRTSPDQWTDGAIEARTNALIELILEVWPAPPGHKSGFTRAAPRLRRKVQLADLINAGVLAAGSPLAPRNKKHSHRQATLLADGSIEVDGTAFENPTLAASAIAGRRIGGWSFFTVDDGSKRTLKALRTEYVAAMSVDDDDDDGEDDDEDEDTK
jgi:hypothetical protein